MQKVLLDDTKPGYDVVIIGAGAAGCSSAFHLDDNGLNILLLDYREFPRFKACSGILVTEAQDYLSDENPPTSIFSSPKKLDFTYADWNNNFEKRVKKGFLNTHRKHLDKWLWDRLKTKKIDFSEKTKLIDFSYTPDKKHIILSLESDGNIKNVITKYLVGCDGALSNIRKKISNVQIPYYVAIQEVIPNTRIPDRAYFIYDDEITDFYCWVIPKGKAVEIGAAVKPQHSRDSFALFKSKIKEKMQISGNGKVEAAMILRPNSIADICLGDENILLAGEAAGLISPSSAEGISYALRSGKFAAESINEKIGMKGNHIINEYKNKVSHLLERLQLKSGKSDNIKKHSTRKKFFD